MATAVLVGFIAIAAMNLTACDSVASGNRTNPSGIQEARFSPPANITINTPADLALIGTRYPASGTYDLGSDLVLTNWTPICDTTSGGPFTGSFDGAGHTITVSSYNATALSSNLNIGIFALSSGATFTNLTVDLEVSPAVIDTAQYAGGLVGQATGTTFRGITVTGTFFVTYTGPRPPSSSVKPIKGALPLIPGVDSDSGFNVGGIAGYALSGSSFTSINTSTKIVAESENTAVFVGGVVGYADAAAFVENHNSGDITGDGPGYNTSAGGIAGYIVSTAVSNSSSSGDIDLTAIGVLFDWTDSWQADAGGLVGYSGGSPDANGRSEIRRSYATGSVTAYAPYPYAGGLVGYNYGYSIFDPDSSGNGSLVSQSYATGNVTATAQSDPNKTVGTIPYAGGLVGYSSITGSQIEDSYATGDATATTDCTYAWAGGIVGGNANDAVVTNTYATGNVNAETGNVAPSYPVLYAVAGPAAGGIAGVNYYTEDTEVSNSLALNGKVDGSPATSPSVEHRVAGSLGDGTGHDGTLINNRGSTAMSITWTPVDDANGEDGSNTAAQPAQSVYTGLGWDFANVWKFISGNNYPILWWQ
jgi:hypothetical protein